MIAEPKALFLLFLVAPIAWLSYHRYRRSAPRIVAVAGGIPEITSNLFLVRWFFSALSFIFALVFGVLAVSGVEWGRKPPPERASSTETVIAIDISRSMLAEDVRPSRLERTKAILRNIFDDYVGDGIAIVLFKGDGIVFLPMTSDRAAFTTHLDAVGTHILTAPGTNLAAGLETALSSFPGVRDARRRIVVFTDGEMLHGDPRKIATEIAEEGVELCIIAAGGATPVPIIVEGERLNDSSGNPIYTSARRDVLELLSDLASGVIYSLDEGDIVPEIKSFIGGKVGVRYGALRDRFRLMLALSTVFLVIWVALRSVRWGSAF